MRECRPRLRQSPLWALLIVWSASGTQTQSPHDLVMFLTHQSFRTENYGQVGVSSLCQEPPGFPEDRTATTDLVAFGNSAVPSIEEAFDSLRERGELSPFKVNAFWLLYAYARIKGPGAFPELRTMLLNTKTRFLGESLDGSISLALGLTSYLSTARLPVNFLRCTGEEPRDNLDRLILAWERGDETGVEAALGPEAKASLAAVLRNKSWRILRSELGPKDGDDTAAMGYRFDSTAQWADPDDPLLEETANNFRPQMGEFVIQTRFKNGLGRDCGKFQVRFLGSGFVASPEYFVDNPDIADLLRGVADCATQQ